jgi:hypothetical protein
MKKSMIGLILSSLLRFWNIFNGEESNTFKTTKGLRQGGPFVPPPLLFNLVGDVIAKMIKRASSKGHIKSILENFAPGGIMAL